MNNKAARGGLVFLLFLGLIFSFTQTSEAAGGRIIRLIGGVRLIGGICLGCTPSPANTYDPATIAWVNAVTTAGGTVSTAQKGYVNTLITCYKSAGVFSLMDREWLLWSDNVQQAETDIINDDAWTSHGANGFTADAGYTGDGSTSYLDTNFNPSTAGGNYSQNSASLDAYITNDAGGDTVGPDANSGACTNSYLVPDTFFGNTFYYELNGCTFPSVADTGGVGLWSVSRTTGSAVSTYKNGSPFASASDASTGNISVDFYIESADNAGTAPATEAMVGIRGGLSTSQVAAKAACDNAYATSKGFNVY